MLFFFFYQNVHYIVCMTKLWEFDVIKNSYLTLKTKKYWKSRNKETNDNLIFGSKGAMFFFWKKFLSPNFIVKKLIDLKVTTKKPDPAVLNEKFEEKLAIFQVQKRNLLNFVSHEKKFWLSWKKHSPPLQSLPKVEKASTPSKFPQGWESFNFCVLCETSSFISHDHEKVQYFKDLRKIFQTLNIT